MTIATYKSLKHVDYIYVKDTNLPRCARKAIYNGPTNRKTGREEDMTCVYLHADESVMSRVIDGENKPVVCYFYLSDSAITSNDLVSILRKDYEQRIVHAENDIRNAREILAKLQ